PQHAAETGIDKLNGLDSRRKIAGFRRQPRGWKIYDKESCGFGFHQPEQPVRDLEALHLGCPGSLLAAQCAHVENMFKSAIDRRFAIEYSPDVSYTIGF